MDKRMNAGIYQELIAIPFLDYPENSRYDLDNTSTSYKHIQNTTIDEKLEA